MPCLSEPCLIQRRSGDMVCSAQIPATLCRPTQDFPRDGLWQNRRVDDCWGSYGSMLMSRTSPSMVPSSSSFSRFHSGGVISRMGDVSSRPSPSSAPISHSRFPFPRPDTTTFLGAYPPVFRKIYGWTLRRMFSLD